MHAPTNAPEDQNQKNYSQALFSSHAILAISTIPSSTFRRDVAFTIVNQSNHVRHALKFAFTLFSIINER
jgi:hypothetical protein